MKLIKKILNCTYDVIEVIGMMILVAMTLIITIQVFCRYCLGFTPGWSEEIALILLVWCCIIGFAIGVKKLLHLSIELIVSQLPGKIQNIVNIIDQLLIVFFGFIMTIYGQALVERMIKSTLPATQLSGAILYCMVPISGILIIIFALANIFNLNDIDKNNQIQ